MTDRDWGDPFSEDEAAEERARRRAEREARRRERRRALADRVRSDGEDPERAAASPRASEPAQAPQPTPPRAERPEPAAREPSPPPDVHRRRRIAAVGALAAAVALVLVGAIAVADRLGGTGDDEAPAAEVDESISVTIPEGMDRRQVAAIARDAGLRGNYVQATRRAQGFNPARFGADDAEHLEGFLFPATYELRPNARVNALVARQLDAFRERIGGVDMDDPRSRGLEVYDVLKIASMIEREVQVPRERRLVSAVIHNRLVDGSPLGIDATIRYEDQNFDEPLTESRLADPTPYNTRVNAGLPPTPIGNPGLAAIRAAANPADVDHFYFVVKPYTCGEHVFTASEEEFHQAVAEYQRALEEEGGAPTPEHC
jgi:hypothetical protein